MIDENLLQCIGTINKQRIYVIKEYVSTLNKQSNINYSEMEWRNNVIKDIKSRMARLDIKQYELATYLNVSASTLSRWMNGSRTANYTLIDDILKKKEKENSQKIQSVL